MFGLGVPEIIIVLVAAGVLIFGGKKIVEVSQAMGRASGEFKKARMDVEKEIEAAKTTNVDSADQTQQGQQSLSEDTQVTNKKK